MSVTYMTTGFGMAPEPSHRERSASPRTMRQYRRPGGSGSILVSATAAAAAADTPSSSGSRRSGSHAPTAAAVLPTPTPSPPPTRPQPTHHAAARAQFSEIDAFFGGQRQSQGSPPPLPSDRAASSASNSSSTTAPSRTSNASPSSSRMSRESRRPGRASSAGHATPIPPQYESQSHFDVESLPSYSKIEDYSADLNRKLFLYGFLFFPFWIIGIIAPFVKPNHNPVIDNRTKEDQELDDANMRKAEMYWSKRCGVALFAFVIVITIAAVVGVTVSKSHHHQ